MVLDDRQLQAKLLRRRLCTRDPFPSQPVERRHGVLLRQPLQSFQQRSPGRRVDSIVGQMVGELSRRAHDRGGGGQGAGGTADPRRGLLPPLDLVQQVAQALAGGQERRPGGSLDGEADQRAERGAVV